MYGYSFRSSNTLHINGHDFPAEIHVLEWGGGSFKLQRHHHASILPQVSPSPPSNHRDP